MDKLVIVILLLVILAFTDLDERINNALGGEGSFGWWALTALTFFGAAAFGWVSLTSAALLLAAVVVIRAIFNRS